jgi:hypothetical protein
LIASPRDVPVLFEKALPMSMVGFPLLLIPLAIYNIIVFLMPGVSLAEPLVTLPLTSGSQWPVTLSDVLLALGILMLLLEVIKGARPGAKYLTDHLLSFVVFGGAAAEFLLWPRFASSTFFLLTLLALVDFLTGIALRARRGAPAKTMATRATRPAPAPAEIRHEPEVVRAPPPVVSEPVPVEHSAPATATVEHTGHAAGSPPEVTVIAPSEEVSYPRLHPGPGMPKPAETKPPETKPSETKPSETKPPETPN